MRILTEIDDAQLDELAARGEFFWLDLVAPADEQLTALAQRFGWHPLAAEDTREFDQRPKLDRYGDHMLLVFYGATGDGALPPPGRDGERPELVEVHLLISGDRVVTVRRRGCDALDELRVRLGREAAPESEQFVIYRIVDALTDTFFPLLDAIDERIDTLEDAILVGGGDRELQQVFQLKRRLGHLRRVVGPQRDLTQRTIDHLAELPGLSLGTRDYFRDVYDHMIRVSDMVDGYRDLLTGLMDVYLSTTSNRMNAVMKQLTLISTVFLPITALTGFFGMNFGWLVNTITSFGAFLVLGIGGAVGSAVMLAVWFKRERFLD
jgi:magnesium transporter